MKSFVQTSSTTLDITDENGNTKEWVQEHSVRGNEAYDFNHMIKIRNVWYVKLKELTMEEEE